jgi:hypothetical protein
VAELTAESIRSGVCGGEGLTYLKEPAIGPAIARWADGRCIAPKTTAPQDCAHVSEITGKVYRLQPDGGTQTPWADLMVDDLNRFDMMSASNTWDCGLLEQVIEHASGPAVPSSVPSFATVLRDQAMAAAGAAVHAGHCSLDSVPAYQKLAGAQPK